MGVSDIITSRLTNQHISTPSFTRPEDVVKWFGAVQAQDYAAAKWALGLRAQNITNEQVESAFNQGRILRIHVMRPTWHFVTPDDIHWLLCLTKERVHKINSYYYRQVGLDEVLLKHCTAIISKALQGKTYLTREELGKKLYESVSITKNNNLTIGYILLYAELEGMICSGPRKGKQCTYALLRERVPMGKPWSREAMLAELTQRYFQSHGPATVHDFAWWSGLSMQDAKKGIALIKATLHHEAVADNVYWFSPQKVSEKAIAEMYLLPNYDEYIVGYTDRSVIFNSAYIKQLDRRANPLFQHTILFHGKIIGTWKREEKKSHPIIHPHTFTQLNTSEKQALDLAIHRFNKFTNASNTGENPAQPE